MHDPGDTGIRQHDDELLATQPSDPVRLTDGTANAVGDGAQHLVAHLVAALVVDLLEVIRIDDEDRAVALIALGTGQFPLQFVENGAPGQNPGQRIAGGKLEQLGLALLLLGNVGQKADGRP